jgi:hypothetical protein
MDTAIETGMIMTGVEDEGRLSLGAAEIHGRVEGVCLISIIPDCSK